MKELLVRTEYTGQEIIDWCERNPHHEMSMELIRKYFQFWEFSMSLHPTRKYTIHSYTTPWHNNCYHDTKQTYKVRKVLITRPLRSSL